MDCSCVYSGCDWCERVKLQSARIRTAVKNHKCAECGRQIVAGESYEFQKYFFDNKFSDHKTCSECKEIRDVFFCDGYEYGNVMCAFREHLYAIKGQISSDCLLDLTPKTQDRVFSEIEGVWSELDED